MSRDNLGTKQTIILHNCLINNELYDLVITQHRRTLGYIKSKDKHEKYSKSNTKAKYQKNSRRRNSISESDTNTIKELQDRKDSINKNNPTEKKKFD